METQEEQRQYPKKIRKCPWPQINLGKWQMEILAIETGIRALKKVMRASGHNITSAEDSKLKSLKTNATTLYQIRAASHGKLHLRSEALKAQEDLIGDILKEFAQAA
jgi:hypothetical protein